MPDWHVKAHWWCTSEGKSPLGNGEQVELVHGLQRGFEAHREIETHTWGGDWVYTYGWSPNLNKDEKNE